MNAFITGCIMFAVYMLTLGGVPYILNKKLKMDDEPITVFKLIVFVVIFAIAFTIASVLVAVFVTAPLNQWIMSQGAE